MCSRWKREHNIQPCEPIRTEERKCNRADQHMEFLHIFTHWCFHNDINKWCRKSPKKAFDQFGKQLNENKVGKLMYLAAIKGEENGIM